MVLAQYCLFTAGCHRVGATYLVSAVTRGGGAAVLVGYAPPAPDDQQPYPWQARPAVGSSTGTAGDRRGHRRESDQLVTVSCRRPRPRRPSRGHVRPLGEPADVPASIWLSHRDATSGSAVILEDVHGEAVSLSLDDLEIMVVMPDATETGAVPAPVAARW